jgi:hypothetical protein
MSGRRWRIWRCGWGEFLLNDERVHHYQRGRASVIGMGLVCSQVKSSELSGSYLLHDASGWACFILFGGAAINHNT